MLLNALYRSDQGIKYYVQGTVGKGDSVAIQQALIHEDPSTGTPDMHMYSPYLTFNVVHGKSPSEPNGLTSFFLYIIDALYYY